jgi:hypothetical protein
VIVAVPRNTAPRLLTDSVTMPVTSMTLRVKAPPPAPAGRGGARHSKLPPLLLTRKATVW